MPVDERGLSYHLEGGMRVYDGLTPYEWEQRYGDSEPQPGGGTSVPSSGEGNRDFRREARALFPWMPNDILIDFANRWAESGDMQIALNEVRQNEALYDRHFPGNRTDDGRLRMSEGDYLRYADEARTLMRRAGIPEGFYDSREDIGNFIEGELSLRELNQRIQRGVIRYNEAPPEVRNELQRVYGVGPGSAVTFFLDEGRALEVIERDYAAATIGGASKMAQYGELSQPQLERLASLGVDEDQAREVFSMLSQQANLFTALPGSREKHIGQQAQIRAAFEQDPKQLQEIERRRRNRQAIFRQRGGSGISGSGMAGFGSSNA